MVLKDKTTRITYHNGVLTIGGTIIEISYEDSHIFFDFGSEYDPAMRHQPCDLQGLLDAGMLPWLAHIYDPSIPLQGYENHTERFAHTAIFLSHVHLDHTKAVNFIDPSIPVYALEGTSSLLKTLNIHDDFLFPRYGKHMTNTRDIIGVKENEEVVVGDIRVKLMSVDHDAYGACGLWIQTPDMTIAYTGDIRLHGYRRNKTLQFCEQAANCDLLICEGVSISFQEVDDDTHTDGEITSEEALITHICDLVDKNPQRALMFHYYVSNIERILQLYRAVSRTVVVEAYYAYTIKEATGVDVPYYQLDERAYGLDPAKRIDFATLIADETRFFWQLATPALFYMDDIKKGGLYIHSNAQPLGSFDPAYAPFMKRFADGGIAVEVVNCSGHAFVKDLAHIVDRIKPKLLTPIHSLHPERLYNPYGDRILPEKKQTITRRK